MVREAEDNAAEDKKRRELVEVKNQADNVLHTTEKTLAEFGDKVGDSERKAIENDVAALKAAAEGDDVAAIRSKIDALQQSSMKLGEAMYKAQQEAGAAEGDAGPSGQAGGAESKGADDVVDADFEEVDDQDRNKSA
jgi:molecular chaperone DnaK